MARIHQLYRFTAPRLRVAALALVVVLLCVSMLEACPTCKEGIAEHDPVTAGMVRGYFYSIIFMMSMPFLILAGLSSYFYFEVRRARLRASATTTPVPQVDVAAAGS